MSINRIAAAAILCLPSWAGAQEAVRARYIMGTVCEITAQGAQAEAGISAAFKEIERWDRILSLYKKESEVSQMNREAGRAPFLCSKSLWEAVTAALDAAKRSQGAFDPTLQNAGYSKILLDKTRHTVFFQAPHLKMDFGGIGKGIALDHAAVALRAQGINRALINFGGQIYALGPWTVQSSAGPLSLQDASVSTSGDGEQPGHIKNPVTGLSVHGPDAVVTASSAAEADAWSTALYVTQGRIPPAFKDCASCRYYRGEKP